MKSSHLRPLYLDQDLVILRLWHRYVLEFEHFWPADVVDLKLDQHVNR
jgi:hypothetical protein